MFNRIILYGMSENEDDCCQIGPPAGVVNRGFGKGGGVQPKGERGWR